MVVERIDPHENSLPDIRPNPGGILLVGINPSPVSVKAVLLFPYVEERDDLRVEFFDHLFAGREVGDQRT